MRTDLIEKLLRLSIKKKEVEALLEDFGFISKPGKGSHTKWIKKGCPPIIIATHDKEIKSYQVRQVIKALKIGGLI